jgi:hypothetical protein
LFNREAVIFQAITADHPKIGMDVHENAVFISEEVLYGGKSPFLVDSGPKVQLTQDNSEQAGILRWTSKSISVSPWRDLERQVAFPMTMVYAICIEFLDEL